MKEYSIKNGDALHELKKIKSGSVDLIITSPPYNIGKSYETKTSIEQYLKSQEKIIKQLFRVLSDKGNICWQVGNYVDKGEVYPLDIYYYQIFKTLGLAIEKVKDFCIITKQRVNELSTGQLKTRPMTKPIHKPSANDKVAQVPNEC